MPVQGAVLYLAQRAAPRAKAWGRSPPPGGGARAPGALFHISSQQFVRRGRGSGRPSGRGHGRKRKTLARICSHDCTSLHTRLNKYCAGGRVPEQTTVHTVSHTPPYTTPNPPTRASSAALGPARPGTARHGLQARHLTRRACCDSCGLWRAVEAVWRPRAHESAPG